MNPKGEDFETVKKRLEDRLFMNAFEKDIEIMMHHHVGLMKYYNVHRDSITNGALNHESLIIETRIIKS